MQIKKPAKETKLTRYLARRDAAFEADDLNWAKEQLPPLTKPAVVEMAFHKARAECLTISDEKRQASADWLAERGLRKLSASFGE